MHFVKTILVTMCLILSAHALAADNVKVRISTNHGDMIAELYPKKAPISVKNFLDYVKEGFYDGTVFHRVIPNFMIQTGGFDLAMKQKETKAPIKNEAHNKISNTRGTLAFARTSDPDSATSQFFINVVDNRYLNQSPGNDGYAVFGRIIDGIHVADEIAAVPTTRKQGMKDVPEQTVVIHSITKEPF